MKCTNRKIGILQNNYQTVSSLMKCDFCKKKIHNHDAKCLTSPSRQQTAGRHYSLTSSKLCIGSQHVVQDVPFFMQFKTLRRRENSSELSPGQIANSISHPAHIAFCSFQYPCAPAAMLANCYHAGLFTDIFHSPHAFLEQKFNLGNK